MSVNGNDLAKVPAAKGQSKKKPVQSFEWDDYLKTQNGVPAPANAFNQPLEPPVNEFGLNQKLELNSPTDFDFVHLATVVGYVGPRLQLRLDGCDSSNDIYELVDSLTIHPIGSRMELKKYFAAPLRFRKDAASYNSYCKSNLKNAVFAPKSAFKEAPTEPKQNLFKVGMKLEAVDQKHPSNICPATIVAIEKDYVTVHLDGWDESNDYKCSYKARTLFPVGWCKKTGYHLQKPGPKVEIHTTKEGDNSNSNLKTDDKEVSVAVKKTPLSAASDAIKKVKENSVGQQPSNVDKSSVVVTVNNTQTLHPKNNLLNNKSEAKPKPLTGAEVKINSSAPTGAKLVNEPLKTKISSPVNHSASINSHKSTLVMSKLPTTTPATVPAPSPSLPPSLPILPIASTVVGTAMKSPATAVSIAPNFAFSRPTSQGNILVPNPLFASSKSANNHNIHISPKKSNIGEQIKQQQMQQQQQQFMQKPMATNYQTFVTQPSTNQMNALNNRGIKRTQTQMTEPRKSQAAIQNAKPVMTLNNSTPFHNFNKPAAPVPVPNYAPIIIQQPGQFRLAPLLPKAPAAHNATLTVNNINSTAVLATNQVPVVNGCKKPSVISTPDSDLPDPNIVKGWSVDEVIHFLGSMLSDFSKYESLFRSHEIDGNAFLLLTNESLIKFMSIKLGYSLKICNIVDRINNSEI